MGFHTIQEDDIAKMEDLHGKTKNKVRKEAKTQVLSFSIIDYFTNKEIYDRINVAKSAKREKKHRKNKNNQS